MNCRWVETEESIYRSIYARHKEDFVIFGTYTNMGTYGDELRESITEWGFKFSEHPIIRHCFSHEVHSYFLLLSATVD